MSRLKPKAAGQQGSVLIVLDVDLCGRTLEDPQRTRSIVIPPGLRLRLCNGSLHLPNQATVVVGPGAQLELVGVDIKGVGRRDTGLITVEGEGASATLRQCTITGMRHSVSKRIEQAHGLLVAKGGSAIVQQCNVLKATNCGICVDGYGSTATVTRTMVQQCDRQGFSALFNGKLTIELSVALRNQHSGFYAKSEGSLVAGPGCRSERNGWSGFEAFDRGQLVAGEGCYAGGNTCHGYSSVWHGSVLQAGPGCIAEHNKGCGFYALGGAKLLAGPGCIAEYNANAGFAAKGDSTCGELVAGPGCHAARNGQGQKDQWVQWEGGMLTRLSK
jgi:hypothetical protein